jgi:hypothetical protein
MHTVICPPAVADADAGMPVCTACCWMVYMYGSLCCCSGLAARCCAAQLDAVQQGGGGGGVGWGVGGGGWGWGVGWGGVGLQDGDMSGMYCAPCSGVRCTGAAQTHAGQHAVHGTSKQRLPPLPDSVISGTGLRQAACGVLGCWLPHVKHPPGLYCILHAGLQDSMTGACMVSWLEGVRSAPQHEGYLASMVC